MSLLVQHTQPKVFYWESGMAGHGCTGYISSAGFDTNSTNHPQYKYMQHVHTKAISKEYTCNNKHLVFNG